MNRNGNTAKKFYARRDEKRREIVGKKGDTRRLGTFKSVPARKKFRKETKR